MSAAADLDYAARERAPELALPAVARLRRLLEQLEAEHVVAARQAGWSWQEIALRLGVTKQAVHRKYRHTKGI